MVSEVNQKAQFQLQTLAVVSDAVIFIFEIVKIASVFAVIDTALSPVQVVGLAPADVEDAWTVKELAETPLAPVVTPIVKLPVSPPDNVVLIVIVDLSSLMETPPRFGPSPEVKV